MLDDGKRDEVKAMADALGIGYIRRAGNEHAKAGNLNSALKVTDGEFILQLDADHVPLPNILDRLLGYFGDGQVAFVQSPQDFYNTDSFTHVVNEEGRSLWEENRIFFSLLPARERQLERGLFLRKLRSAAQDGIRRDRRLLHQDNHRGHGDLDRPARTWMEVGLSRGDARLRPCPVVGARVSRAATPVGARGRCRSCAS